MRYPNTRYGNPEELKYYSVGLPVKILAKKLKRSEKSINAWLNGDRKIPFLVPELMRLWHMERDLTMRQMGMGEQKRRLGLVTGQVIDFPPPKENANAKITAHHHPFQPRRDTDRNCSLHDDAPASRSDDNRSFG